MDEFKTPAQFAKAYPVSRSTLYSAMQDGLLPYYRLPSKKGRKGKYLIKVSDFIAWLESNRHDAGQPVPDGNLKYL